MTETSRESSPNGYPLDVDSIKMATCYAQKTNRLHSQSEGENPMRNRTWLAVVAGVAVVAVAVQFQFARSQERKAKAMQKKAAAAAEHAEMAGDKVTYAIAMVEGLGDHKVKGKVTFTQKGDSVEIVGEF